MAALADILAVITTLLVLVAAVICAYHIALMIVALATPRQFEQPHTAPLHSFAIVIPAHNEEASISTTLCSCKQLDYPRDKYQVYVIADNCTDRTADIATEWGVHCLTRNDELRRGKGQALEWAIPILLDNKCDAVVILDADCTISSHALTAASRHLHKGVKALQFNNVVANPDVNALSLLLAVANKIENDLFYAPKSLLKMAVFLRGTGMVLHRDLLTHVPWQAGSVVEDAEYSFQLFDANMRVEFVPEAFVFSDFPTKSEQLTIQRTRWIGGGTLLAIKHGVCKVLKGLLQHRILLVDAGLTAFLVSRPLVIAQLCVAAVFAIALWIWHPGFLAGSLLLAILVTLLFYNVYIVVGAIRLGISSRRVVHFVHMPVVALRYLLIATYAVLRPQNYIWQRSPRNAEIASRRTDVMSHDQVS